MDTDWRKVKHHCAQFRILREKLSTFAFNCGGHPSWKTIDFAEWPVCVGARQQEGGTRAGGAQCTVEQRLY